MAEEAVNAPDSSAGAFSIEQAVAERAQRRREDAPSVAATAPATEAPAEAPVASVDGASGDPDMDDAEAPSAGVAAGENLTALQPPHAWSPEAKARFAELPPDLQAVVAEQARAGESVAGRAREAAAQARARAEQEAGAYSQRAERLGELMQHAETTFSGKWDGVDWVGLARHAASQEYNAIRAEFEAEQRQLAALSQERIQADQLRRQTHLQQVVRELPELAPELVDPKQGVARIQALQSYLAQQGYDGERLQWASARDLAIAHKAHLYDQGRAKLAAAPKTAPPPARPPARPAAGSSAGSYQQQRLAGLDAKAAKSGRFDDVLAARRARREGGR